MLCPRTFAKPTIPTMESKTRERSHNANIEATTAQLFDPIYKICHLVKSVSKVVADQLPSQDEIWAAQRKGELTMGQIKSIRQCEKRMDDDQTFVERVIKSLDDMEESMASLEEKAEEIESAMELKIPQLKELLLCKYQFSIGSSSHSSTASADDTVNNIDKADTEKMPVKQLSARQFEPIPSSLQKNVPKIKGPPVSSLPESPMKRSSVPPILRESECRQSARKMPPQCVMQGSGIKPPGFRQSSLATSCLNVSSYQSPNQSYMPVYKPVPQSATTRPINPLATPQQTVKFRPLMMASSHSAMSLNYSAQKLDYSSQKQNPLRVPAPTPPSRSNIDEIDSVLARLQKRPGPLKQV